MGRRWWARNVQCVAHCRPTRPWEASGFSPYPSDVAPGVTEWVVDPVVRVPTLVAMRFAVCALLAWMCFGWSARGEGVELTVGKIVLKNAVEEDRNSAIRQEQPITGRFEPAADLGSPQTVKAALLVAKEKVTFEAGGKTKSFQLKPGDFVGSLVWTSNDAATLVVWNTRGVGQWLRYLLAVSVDREGGIQHRLVKANQISQKLTVQRLIAKEGDGVRARVRVLGEDKRVRYFEALIDVAALPDLSAKAAAQYGPRVE